jgi:hypothetical protein
MFHIPHSTKYHKRGNRDSIRRVRGCSCHKFCKSTRSLSNIAILSIHSSSSSNSNRNSNQRSSRAWLRRYLQDRISSKLKCWRHNFPQRTNLSWKSNPSIWMQVRCLTITTTITSCPQSKRKATTNLMNFPTVRITLWAPIDPNSQWTKIYPSKSHMNPLKATDREQLRLRYLQMRMIMLLTKIVLMLSSSKSQGGSNQLRV